MKPHLITVCLMGLFSFLFGCKQQEIPKEALYGNWEAVKLNSGPINKHGFTSIKMNITPDSIHITTEMKTFGEITTKSEGTWQLIGNVFKSKIGEAEKDSRIKVRGANIIFMPDPLFKQETVYESEYQKVP
jgi:hypothetical protein